MVKIERGAKKAGNDMNTEEIRKYERYDRTLALFLWIGLSLVLLYNLYPEFASYKEGVYVYVGAGAVFTLFYHHLLPKRFMGRRKLILESYLDIFAIAVLMVLTEGHSSLFFFYYFLIVAGSALIFDRRRVIIESLLITTLLLGVLALDYFFRPGAAHEIPHHTIHILILISSLWIVAFWSGSLASILGNVLKAEKALTVKNKELYEKESEARRELVTIQKTSASLLSNLRLDTVLRNISEGLTNGVGYDRAAIFLINRERKTIEGKYASGLSPELTQKTKIPLLEGKGMLFESIWQAKPFIVKSLFDNLRIVSKLKELRPTWPSRLAVVPIVSRLDQGSCAKMTNCNNSICPLYRPDPEHSEVLALGANPDAPTERKKAEALDCPKFKVFGAIVVDNFKSKKPITEDNLAALQIFAQNAAIAIENATLYEKKEKTRSIHN